MSRRTARAVIVFGWSVILAAVAFLHYEATLSPSGKNNDTQRLWITMAVFADLVLAVAIGALLIEAHAVLRKNKP